jgi:hypothetical protein
MRISNSFFSAHACESRHPAFDENWVPAFAGTSGDYAASAFAGFSGAVIAPETLISATSFSE